MKVKGIRHEKYIQYNENYDSNKNNGMRSCKDIEIQKCLLKPLFK